MENDTLSSIDAEREVLLRLAILEERTKPKKKSFVEIIQAYGGLIALVITLGYSWPLGVWDRFIVNPQNAIERKITSLRESLSRANDLSVELGKIQSSISNPELRDLAARSVTNQLLLLIVKHDEDYSKHRQRLFPEELIMIGLMYQNLYRFEESLRYFEYVTKRSDSSETLLLEANRQIAKTYMFPSSFQDLKKARSIYQHIIPEAIKSPRIDMVGQAVMIQAEWGFLEMTAGDWRCGVQNMNSAIRELTRLQPMMNDHGNFMNLLKAKQKSLKVQNGQPQKGCSS